MRRHEIRLDNDKYWIDNDPKIMEEWQWCYRTFGPAKNNRDPDYWQGGIGWSKIVFRFNNPTHATLFSLRWS